MKETKEGKDAGTVETGWWYCISFAIWTSAVIHIYTVDNIKVDFVHYSCYPWLEDVIFEDGIRLASPVDIAAMKINAIEGRGTRKDFVDVFFLLKHYSLQEILSFYKAKYPNSWPIYDDSCSKIINSQLTNS